MAPELPAAVEDLTPDWFTAALRPRFPEAVVTHVVRRSVIWGTATKVMLTLSYSVSNGHAPRQICVKGGFDERLRGLGTTRAYRIEAGFFNDLAPQLDLPLPGCWFAAVDEDRRQGVLVMDDLDAAGATFGSPLEPWSADRVAQALEVLARLHAQTVGTRAEDHAWMPATTIVADVTPVLLDVSHWETQFAAPGAPELPVPLQDRERVLRSLQAMWASHRGEPWCVTHGDAHVGNTYIDRAGNPAFLDWQAVCTGPPLDDVSYFLGGALTVADRRAHERALLAHYVTALSAFGGPAISVDAAWAGYRRYALHGFLWTVTPAVMQPAENVRAMAARHIAAIQDLDALAA